MTAPEHSELDPHAKKSSASNQPSRTKDALLRPPANTSKQDVLEGRPPTATEDTWLDVVHESIKGSVSTIQETAKNLLTAISIISGLYLNAVSFEKVPDKIKVIAGGGSEFWSTFGLALMFVAPLICWLVASVFTAWALMVRRYSVYAESPDSVKNEFGLIADSKYKKVRFAFVFLLIGLSIMIFNVIIYLMN